MRLSECIELFKEIVSCESSPRTFSWYMTPLKHFQQYLVEAGKGDPPIHEITTRDLRRWQLWLEKENPWQRHPTKPAQMRSYSPVTIETYVKAIRRFFNRMYKEGYLEVNPAASLKLPSTPDTPLKVISEEELAKLIEGARENGPRDLAIVLFLVETGCRVGGLCSLTMENLDLEERRAVIYQKGRGGAKECVVFFGEATEKALRKWLKERPSDDSNYVFLSTRGGPLSPTGVYQILKRIAKRKNIKRFNPHSIRHRFARIALENGADLSTVSQLLHHSSIEVTHRHYAKWEQRRLKSARDRFISLPKE